MSFFAFRSMAVPKRNRFFLERGSQGVCFFLDGGVKESLFFFEGGQEFLGPLRGTSGAAQGRPEAKEVREGWLILKVA